MPLITEREAVCAIYRQAGVRGWVVPTFCAENLTTIEAVLAAVHAHGQSIGDPHLPITLAVTNLYAHRAQSTWYTQTRDWAVGLKLFLADLHVLTSPGSPYADLAVMVHLDHIQPEADAELLQWDLRQFSSIMYDASALPLEQNITTTRAFMRAHGAEIVIEGACDEIRDAGGQERCACTTPEEAEHYAAETGVDFLVVNLGTEHRASAAELTYHGEVARAISRRVGAKLVLHGCSSVPAGQLGALYADGVCKVNIWTVLERDSSTRLFTDMLHHPAHIAGRAVAAQLQQTGLLGPRVDCDHPADLGYFTTAYRQQIVFEAMREIVRGYLRIWYV